MSQTWAKAFYGSEKWLRCRNSYIKKRIMVDGGLCEECHESLGYIVHHKTMLTSENIADPEISLSHDNLEYVCKECHDLFEGHGLNKSAAPLCKFDSSGQPISLRKIDKPPVKNESSKNKMTVGGLSFNTQVMHKGGVVYDDRCRI